MRREGAMAALRIAAIAAAALACLGLALPLPTRERTIVALIDASDSIGSAGIEASRSAALGLIRSLGPRDRAALAVFAGKPAVLLPPSEPEAAAAALETARLEAPSPGTTDIATAIAAAEELAAAGRGSKSIYLFSDGRSTSGSSPTEAESPKAEAKLYAVASGGGAAGTVSEGLSLPSAARPGERVAASWRIYAQEAGKIEYSLLVDGEVVQKGDASLKAGVNEIPLALDAGGTGRRSIVARASQSGGAPGGGALSSDAPDEGARLLSGAYLDVGGPAKVLVVGSSSARGASPIARSLVAQGIEAVASGPASLPEDSSGYAALAAVVLDDLPALEITEAQQSCLQDYVASGGGLLVVGGESSLGRGDYYATPLEDMLPVQTDSRRRLQFTRAKLLFVIDHSGSMGEMVGGVSKQTAAMRGVAAAIDELDPLDEVGIIGFDTDPSWVIPFTPASRKQKILNALSRLGDGGGTDLSKALDEALRAFGEVGPTKRHAIILTDGITPEADFRGLASRFVAAGVNASTIAIGAEANEKLLKDFASWCGGAYYRAEGDKIPSIIDQETIRMSRDLMREGDVATRVAAASPVAEGLLEGSPPIRGYLLTKAKSLSTVLLEARLKESESWDPLLASWRYGSGRVAVFTSDSGARWLSSWEGIAAYNSLWGQLVRSIERSAPEGGLRARASSEAGGARVVVEARGPDRRSLSGLRLRGKVQGPGGSTFALRESSPGRYEGFAPLSGKGLFGIEIMEARSDARASTWAWRESSGEVARGADKAELSLIAAGGGGELLEAAGLVAPKARTSWSAFDLALPLLALAALLFLAELYLRSTMAGQLERAKAALASWWAGERAAVELARGARRPMREELSDEERDRRFIEMQRKLALRVARRNKDDTGAKDA
jgi:Ca-activated chloride channel homolog